VGKGAPLTQTARGGHRASSRKDDTMNDELLAAVKELVAASCGYLDDGSGDDSCRITAMEESVTAVLDKARAIPELQDWVVDFELQRRRRREALHALWAKNARRTLWRVHHPDRVN
jgi:hypothetical protein